MEFFATSNGIPVHVSDTGKGDINILLLHGYLETLYVWEDIIPYFPKNYRFISIDLPGHGLSGSHSQVNSMKFCADTIQELLVKLDIQNYYVVGHSLGGYIGIELLRSYKEFIQGLILINSNSFADSESVSLEREKEIHFITQGRLLTLASIAIPNMFKPSNLRLFDSKIQELLEIAETHDPEGIAASVRGMSEREDTTTFLSSVNVPMMAIFGDSDRYFTLDDINLMVSKIPSLKHYIIPNTGHNSYIENPQQVVEKIVDFVTKGSC